MTILYSFKTSKWVPIIIITLAIWTFLAVEVSYMQKGHSEETEKNLTLTIYSDQYTICHLDKTHHYSPECWLVSSGKNIRDYLEALAEVK